MHIHGLFRAALLLVCLSAAALASEPASEPDPTASAIGAALRSGAGIPPNSLERLRAFYTARQDRPAWYNTGGPNADGTLAVSTIAGAADDGLDPLQYDIVAISKPPSASDPGSIAYRDILLSMQLMRYAADVRDGRDSLKNIDRDVDVPPSGFDPAAALAQALAEKKLAEFLRSLQPQSVDYSALKAALARYRALSAAGGWVALPPTKPFGARTAAPDVLLALETRLAAEDGQLAAVSPPKPEDVDSALRRFQQRNGLPVDGVVGAATLAALNVTNAARVSQIEANMERSRWLPHTSGKSYVVVNVPDATLHVIDNGTEILTSRVIVGRRADPTPIFQAEITDVVANPPWNIPAKIVRTEIMPKLRKNPSYLTDHDMVASNGQIQQLPGAKNSLGLIKLNVSDRFSVYLHDTPSRTLFARDQRFLSHGCIRVQQITPLASYAITGDITGGVDKLMAAIATGTTVHLSMPAPIPLYVEYFTAFPGADGTLQFRPDIYGRDARIAAAMSGTSVTQAIGSGGGCGRPG